MGASKKTFMEQRLYRMLEYSTYGVFHPEFDPDLWMGRYGQAANEELNKLDENKNKKYNYTVRFTDESTGETVETKKYDSLNNIEKELKEKGIDNWEVF